ncbi:MAG: glycosyl hydrolase [Mangrovibacterium sp.]
MKQLFFLIFIASIFSSCKKPGESLGECINADIFLNPPADFRSAPFYSLNDKLDTNEVVRQIRGFKEGGYGGSFLHSRSGLLIEYLGKEWWESMGAAVRASKELGLKAWFYDEDKWPSGFGGGKVPMISGDFYSRHLARVGKNERMTGDDQLIYEDGHYRYVCHRSRMGDAWFNGTTYVDLLNPEVVKAFIANGYTPYLERYTNEIGKTVPGIFTDEPQVSARISGGGPSSVSFSSVLIEKFKEMHEYDLLPAIPALFDTVGNFQKIRYDYYQTLSRCFEESFSKQIGDYCVRHKTVFTGHFNGEESFVSVMANSGNSMIQYRHMQMPGIDQLGLQYLPLNAPRSVSSVANQYGIPRRLSESYGISGQNMNFEDRKWLLDFLTLNGINFIVPHLSLYSMKGERKRDYPPNFSPAQPYWGYNKLFEDYTGRMCYANTIGKYAAQIIVVHPLESEYLGVRNGCYQQYDRCLNLLQNNHREYDLGDEQVIADIAEIRGSRFVMGQMSYQLVVLPNMLAIRKTTLNILKQFNASGGKILVLGRYPEFVDGERNDKEIAGLKQISQFVKTNKFAEILDQVLPSEYTLKGENNEFVWGHFRITKNGGVLQLSNTSRLKEVDCQLSFSPAVGQLALWNPETGKSMKLVQEKDGTVNLHFAATQTWLVTFGGASEEAEMTETYQVPGKREELLKISGPWKGHRLDPNALTLDFARYSIDNGKTFSYPEPVIGIHQRLTNQKYTGKLILKFEPEVATVPLNCSLVLEQPQLYEIFINGKNVRFEGKESYRDHAFRTQDISGILKTGSNEIILSVDYVAPEPASFDAVKRYGTEIESIYLTGDFGVVVFPSEIPRPGSQKYRSGQLVIKPVSQFSQFTISKEDSLFENDLVTQGYPFYAGAFSLTNSFNIEQIAKGEKYFISFPLYEAIVLKARVNGKEFAPLLYSPSETDITGAVKEGENHVEITLINSLRNLLGPHHHAEGELIEVGPASFTGNPYWPNQGGEDNWYELRKKGKASLWRDDYCLVPFGLLGQPIVLKTK